MEPTLKAYQKRDRNQNSRTCLHEWLCSGGLTFAGVEPLVSHIPRALDTSVGFGSYRNRTVQSSHTCYQAPHTVQLFLQVTAALPHQPKEERGMVERESERPGQRRAERSCQEEEFRNRTFEVKLKTKSRQTEWRNRVKMEMENMYYLP